MALSKDQLTNIRNGVERSSLRGFAIDYTKPEIEISLNALDNEFEAVTKTIFETRLGVKLSVGAKRIFIKQWLLIKGRDF